jgi:hypothetical protein
MIRGHVQEERAVAADRLLVEAEERRRRLDRSVFRRFVKPSRANRDVALRGYPVVPQAGAFAQLVTERRPYATAAFDPQERQVNANFGKVTDTRPPRRIELGIRLISDGTASFLARRFAAQLDVIRQGGDERPHLRMRRQNIGRDAIRVERGRADGTDGRHDDVAVQGVD